MADIGSPTPEGTLHLPTVGDWEYSWVMREAAATDSPEVDFPEGAKVWLLLGDAGSTQVRWDFVIDGATASIKTESEEVAVVDEGTKYWLMFSPGPTTPTTEREIQTGTVAKVNAT